MSLVQPPPAPEEINGNAAQHYRDTDDGIGQVLIYRVGYHYPAYGDKKERRYWVARHFVAWRHLGSCGRVVLRGTAGYSCLVSGGVSSPPPEYEDTGSGQTKKHEVDRNHIVQDLIVPPRNSDNY